MFPWDFGIINAIKQGIGLDIYPSHPPDNQRKTPYLVFELKNIRTEKRMLSRTEFSMTIVDDGTCAGECFKVLKTINKIISEELTLNHEELQIGAARIKITSVECKKNILTLNCVAMLRLTPSCSNNYDNTGCGGNE
ncbi:MAG: hypothetical protein LBT90_04170 [Holosporaceae bacterium]|jgi:hypothetical protein|nr:hypothetical protein [Holosporaceae bacterium]